MDLSEVKLVIRGILISNPKSMTVKELEIDFRKSEGLEIPFKKLGFSNALDFLKSIPDTVKLDGSNHYNPVVIPVKNERTSHIDSLVMRQRVPSNRRYMGPTTRRHQAVRAVVPVPSTLPKQPTPPLMEKVIEKPSSLLGEGPANFNPNYNNLNSARTCYKPEPSPSPPSSVILVPWNILNLISHMCRHPQGCSLAEIERNLRGDFIKAGIKNMTDIINDLHNYFEIRGGRIYKKTTGLSSLNQSSVSSNRISSPTSEWTATEVAAAAVGTTNDSSAPEPVKRKLPRWAPTPETVFIPGGAESSMMNRSFSDYSDTGSNASDQHRKTSLPMEECRTVVNDDEDEDDGVESMISSKMKANLKHLIKKYPEGIYCTELSDLYLKEFKSSLNYDEYGYDCVINMVSDLRSIFTLKRENRNSDWKLFSASLLKNETFVEDKTKKWVSREIIQNVCSVLEANPAGLEMDMLCDEYLAHHQRPLNIENIGFDSVQSLLDSMSDYIHQRKVRNKMLLYIKPEKNVPNHRSSLNLPFTDPSDYDYNDDPLPDCNMLLSSLYPEEVCGRDDVYKKQELPRVAKSNSTFFEVRVSEVCNPHKFWIQLGSEYGKLDRMMRDLDSFYNMEEYNYKMPDMTIRPGQVCACPYDVEAKWHRTVVINSCSAVEVKIEYVDYGTLCRVPKTKLRFLHKDFLELPAQAVRAKLASILPPGGKGKWPPDSCRKMLSMVVDKRLFMEACSIDYEEGVIEAVLFDTNGVDDIVVNDDLVNYGFAQFIPLNDASPDQSDGDDQDGFENEVSDQLSNKEELLPATSALNSTHGSNESNLMYANASGGNAGSVIEGVINEAYPQISSSLPDLPYGVKEPFSRANTVSSHSTIQSSYPGGVDSSGLPGAPRPPPGFLPLNSSNASGIGQQLPGNTAGYGGPGTIPSVPAQPSVLPKPANFDMFVSMLSSNAASTNFFQMCNGYPAQPAAKPNQYSSFPDMNAPAWNNFSAAAAASMNNNPSIWYNMPPAATPRPPLSFGQITGPSQPMLFSQPPPNICPPYSNNNTSTCPRYPSDALYSAVPSPPVSYNQQYNNFSFAPPYLPSQIPQPNPVLNQWPPALPPPPVGITRPSPQVSPVGTVQGKENQQVLDPDYSHEQSESPTDIKTETNQRQSPSSTKSCEIVTDTNKSNCNVSDDEKQIKLSSKQRKKLEKRQQELCNSNASSNACASSIISEKSESDKSGMVACSTNKNSDRNVIKIQENIGSKIIENDSKKDSCQNSTATSKKKKKRDKSLSDEEQVNEEIGIALVSPTSSRCSPSVDSNIDNSNSNNKDNVTIASSTSLVSPLRVGSQCSFTSVTPVSLRRPKLLPSSNVNLLLANIESNSSSQASKSAKEESEKNTASPSEVVAQSSKKSSEILSVTNVNNNNSDEAVVDSWEELADDTIKLKDESCKSNSNISNKNEKNKFSVKDNKNNVNNNNVTSNNNNKNAPKSKKQKDKQQKNNTKQTVPSNTSSVKTSTGPISKKSNNSNSKASINTTVAGSEVVTATVIPASTNTSQKSNDANKERERKMSTSDKEWIWGPSDISYDSSDNCNKNSASAETSKLSAPSQVQNVSLEPNSNAKKTLSMGKYGKNSVPKENSNPSSNSLFDQYVKVNDWKLLTDIKIPERSRTNSSGSNSCNINDNNVASTSCMTIPFNSQITDTNSELGGETGDAKEIPIVLNFVIQKVINKKTVHLIIESLADKKVVIASDEFVKAFTSFSKRYSVLKLLGFKKIDSPFYDVHKKNLPVVFKELESCTIEGVLKKGEPVPDKLNVLPLTTAPVVLKALNIDQAVVDNFNVAIDEMNKMLTDYGS